MARGTGATFTCCVHGSIGVAPSSTPCERPRSSIPSLRRINKDADPSEIKGWVTLSDKPPRPTKMTAENEE